MPRRTRPNPPKVRRQWTRNPATQVQPNRRGYDRKREPQAREEDWGDLTQRRYAGASRTAPGRILGIDFGERRVGLAVSDPEGRIAQGLDTLETDNPEQTLEAIVALVGRYEARRIVVGLPINMDGTESEMTKRVRTLAAGLEERVGCEVVTWDERLTSAAAERVMAEMGREVKGRKKELDRISATIILQGYLDSIRRPDNFT